MRQLGSTVNYEQRTVRARTLVASLDVPRPLTAEALHAHMESVRGTRIVIQTATPRMLEVGICGLWLEVAGENFERIHVAPTESAVHRQQFINHEFGHMLLNQDKELLSAARVALLTPLIPLDAVAYALSRSNFTEDQEAMAEAIGDRLALLMLEDGPAAAQGPRTGFGKVL